MPEINKEEKTTFVQNLLVIIIQDDVCKNLTVLIWITPTGTGFHTNSFEKDN